MLFAYPKQAEFGRTLPKNKIYEHGRVSASLKKKFVSDIDKIVWAYKLAPETLNLPARPGVPEIQVFSVALRTDEIDQKVFRCIDAAITFPIIYELSFSGKLKTMAAYKRPSDADPAKWVVDAYFEGGWVQRQSERSPLPVVLDLKSLYEQVIRALIPIAAREDESLRGTVDRYSALRSKQFEAQKLEARLRKEKQFNRKVELNAELRKLKQEIDSLID